MGRRARLQRLIFKSDQEPSLDLKNKVVAELGGSHDVIVEASPVNEHQSNGVVEVQTVEGMIQTQLTYWRLNSCTARSWELIVW